MNKQEQIFFKALSKDRAENARMLEKPSMSGIQKSVVEKYSDQAHFIYELLQNANDAHATRARFILEPTRLIFAHNGTRLFSVSDPHQEAFDSLEGKLGDVNAITSIANSNKTAGSIGKFGVGFKAVFQYTATPHIYDPNFRFKIERFIVPKLLPEDLPLRQPNETLFVFPFDRKNQDPKQAYEEILNKLKNLSYPLLFLSELENIELEFGHEIGFYTKTITNPYMFNKTKAEKVHLTKCITQNKGDQLEEETLWLFSQVNENYYKYSVGFFLDPKGNLRPTTLPAFCFFPTKEVTGLKFIVHAPFLLTDSREGILAGKTHNQNMIQSLADLAAEAFLYLKEIGYRESIQLIDDNILQIIPYDESIFSPLEDTSKISFLPFYKSIQKIFQTEEILPTSEKNKYVCASHAYWASMAALPKLFSNEQLKNLANGQDRSWIFISKSREALKEGNGSLINYIDQLKVTSLTDIDIIKGWYGEFGQRGGDGITAEFIESQSLDWLEQFYKWINGSTHRRSTISNRPIFLNQNRKAVAAFKGDILNLFLPREDEMIEEYNLVHPDLLKREEAFKLIKAIGIKAPSRKDYIYSVLLPTYKNSYSVIKESHFQILFNYFCESSSQEAEELIKAFYFSFFLEGTNLSYSGNFWPTTVYFPTQASKKFFKPTTNTHFIAFKKYLNLVGEKREKQLTFFLEKLGVKKDPSVYNNTYKKTGYREEEYYIEGLENLIEDVAEKTDQDYSSYLWDTLCSFIEKGLLSSAVLYLRIGRHKEGQRALEYSHDTPSPTLVALRTKKWLVDSQGNFVIATDLTKDKLASIYNLNHPEANSLISILGIKDSADWNLTDEQRQYIEMGRKLVQMGMSPSEFEDKLKRLEKFEQRKETFRKEPQSKNASSSTFKGSSSNGETLGERSSLLPPKKRKVIHDILDYTEGAISKAPVDREEESDQDDYLSAPVNYSKRIERAKKKSAAEIDQIIYLEELYDQAKEKTRYSFGWFKALLELEMLKSIEENRNQKEITIHFSKVEREPETLRTLILKHPNRPIPQFIEDLGDIQLVLDMDQTTKTIPIEVSSIQSYTLRVKIKKNVDLEEIDFSTVHAATIEVKSPVFLLEKLQEAFETLKYSDDFDMSKHLPKNIEFVFGPPGTGKTTHLVTEHLIPLMEKKSSCKVLVLTPTNKAADVLVNKIIEKAPKFYEDWLVRFGSTGDEEIEQSSIFVEKDFDIKNASKNVTITTISRFTYDFFLHQNAIIFLDEVKWDYIIIDEASMIPLVNIIYPLYNRAPKKFIIAGDPFQIEPITAVDLWKEENIYTLVGLNSFKSRKTKPHKYKVTPLETQYRSIETIGEIFSQFSYNGILKHHRPSWTKKSLRLKEGPKIAPLNIIKFPVSPYESIYRSKRLQKSSPYHIYSALFTYEYVSYLSNLIAQANPRKPFKIGVIAPYRAQADLIDKLIATKTFPKEIEVQVGTIHGFQGDECDIIFVVFNAPPTISSSKNMFLNNPNIINVAISRARDYLFILMPDDNTQNVDKLTQVKKLERLIKDSNSWTESSTAQLESIMFGTPNFLENHSFSTSHQDVNVYGLPEKIYEIRTEENAIDLQIHQLNVNLAIRSVSTNTSSLTSSASTSVSSSTNRAEPSTNFTFTSASSSTNPASKSTSSSPSVAPINTNSSANSTSTSTSSSINPALKIDEDGDLIVNIRNSKGKLREFYLVPFSGKVEQYTDEKLVQGFIFPLAQHKDAPKYATAWVDLKNRTLFISKFIFNLYEWFFTETPYLELCKSRPRI